MTPDQVDEIGRIVHESWCKTKRAEGYHGPSDECIAKGGASKQYRCGTPDPVFGGDLRCGKYHADLIFWEQLPEEKKDINRHAADALIENGVLVTREQAAQERAAAVAAFKRTVKLEINTGRASQNFGHFREVARALDWLIPDIEKLPADDSALEAALEREWVTCQARIGDALDDLAGTFDSADISEPIRTAAAITRQLKRGGHGPNDSKSLKGEAP